METFSHKVKHEISSLNPKAKNCCLYSFLYGMTFSCVAGEEAYVLKTTFVENANSLHERMKGLLSKKESAYKLENKRISINKGVVRYSTLAEINSNVLKCTHCLEHFLRGVFFACGSISSPEKSHRLELVFENNEHAEELKSHLLDNRLKFNVALRNNKTVLYIKRSEAIEDFLALMGANNSAFEMINSKIKHEVRNVANRATNCDSANINKSLNASKKYINAINEITRLGYFDDLSESLQEIAKARINNPDTSIEDLGKMLVPPISKSGVHHRLEKILRFYNNLTK